MPELTFRQLLPHLEALAYLLEVVAAQAMFLAGFRRREPRSPLRNLPLDPLAVGLQLQSQGN